MLITCEKACEHFFIIDIFTLDTIPNRIKQIALFHINLYHYITKHLLKK